VVLVYVAYAMFFDGYDNHRISSSQLHSRRKQAFHAILRFVKQQWVRRAFKICRPFIREVLTMFEVQQLNHLLDSLFPEFAPPRKPRRILGYPASWMILSTIMLHHSVCARHGWSITRRPLPSFPNCEIVVRQIAVPQQHDLRPTPRLPLLNQRFDIQLSSQLPYHYSISESTQLNYVCSEPRILSANESPDHGFTTTIVLDTGSSFSLTPYEDDLIYTLKEGNLGSVSTVDNSKLPLTKLGYAEYFIRDTNGNDVPFYPIVFVIPNTDQRLLSPQDYARTLPWRDDSYIEEHQPDMYGGTESYVWFAINEDWAYAGTDISPRSNLPHFSIRRRVASDPPRTFHPRYTRAEPAPPTSGKDYGPDEKVCHGYEYCNCKAQREGRVNNVTTYSQQNEQLTPAQRTLLLWHNRLGHRGFQHVQRLFSFCDSSRGTPFNTDDCAPCLPLPSGITKAIVNKVTVPLCLACELAKATKRGPDTFRGLRLPGAEMRLKTDDLRPGDRVSIDHYECPDRGRLRTTFGREAHQRQYCGGLILADHASGYIRVYHQVSLGSSDTILSKTAFEKHCAEANVNIRAYHSDNGTFTSHAYRDELERCGQTITFSGAGAHHQNGVAERGIRTIVTMARSMLLQMSQHWPAESHLNLWPFAMEYAVWLHNHTPNKETRRAPIEIFTGTNLGCQQIQRAKVFGSPAFVLDPRLADGRKIPKWDPRSSRGQFLGFSQEHSSTTALIRNLNTGSITAQFNVVHDETFSTVPLDSASIAHPSVWNDLFQMGRTAYHHDDDDPTTAPTDAPPPPLAAEWLPSDSSENQRENDDDPASVKSRTGFIVTLSGVPIVWTSKLQTEIASSTMMAEYIALSTAMRTLIPLRVTLQEILSTLDDTTSSDVATIKSTVWEDNNPALILANAELPRLTPGSKHFAVKYHWFRASIKKDELEVKRISTSKQAADILTKALTRVPFESMRRLVNGW
jgi:hypothetical protein